MAFSQKINSTIIVVLVLLVHCSNQKSDDDENGPYEFGFMINGEQHRYEKKDINGIIQGEFGFITADGVYHVTVYATDENGNFRILSTKNIKISGPLDGKTSTSNGYSPSPKRVGKTIDLSKASENVTPTPKAFSLSTASTIKPGCGGCGILAPGTITPLPRVHFNKNKEPSRDQNQLTLNLKTSRESNDNFENVNGPIQNQPTNITSLLHNNSDDSNSKVINLSIPKIETISDDLNTVTNQEEDISLSIRNRTTFQDKQQNPNSNQPHVLLSDDVGPQPVDYSESNSKHPLFNKNAFFEKKEGKSNDNNQIAQPPGLEIFDKISVTGNAENNINNVNTRTSTGTGTGTDSNISQAKVVDGNIIVPGNDPIPIQDKYPSMVDGLPDGITEGDVTGLLYKFNYTLSFHGHYEKGLKNGAKIGGYFVNGRDGFSRIVTYVADENGYRPKFQLVNLGLDSLDTPKEDSEKTFELKGFEFIWYPIK